MKSRQGGSVYRMSYRWVSSLSEGNSATWYDILIPNSRGETEIAQFSKHHQRMLSIGLPERASK